MRKRFQLVAVVGLVAIAALFAACGGDDDDNGNDGGQTSEIRTQKGLTVAALNALRASTESDDGGAAGGDSAVLPGAPQPASDAAVSQRNAGFDSAGLNGLPALQQGGTGLSVIGYGTATATADSAVVELYFGTNYGDVKPMPEPLPPSDGGSSSGNSGSGSAPGGGTEEAPVPQEVAPITEADLQPVIDALVNAGVSREDIEFVDQGYYDPYYSSATLRVTVDNVDSVDGVVQAGSDAAAQLTDILFNGSNASYTVSDCAALQQAALETALEDAGDRAQVLAGVLGVSVGNIIGASDYSYAPYGGDACGGGYFGPYPLAVDYAVRGSGPQDVEVYAQIGVTYAIQ